MKITKSNGSMIHFWRMHEVAQFKELQLLALLWQLHFSALEIVGCYLNWAGFHPLFSIVTLFIISANQLLLGYYNKRVFIYCKALGGTQIFLAVMQRVNAGGRRREAKRKTLKRFHASFFYINYVRASNGKTAHHFLTISLILKTVSFGSIQS